MKDQWSNRVCDVSHLASLDSHELYTCHLVGPFSLAVAMGRSTQVDGEAGFRIMLADMPDIKVGVDFCNAALKLFLDGNARKKRLSILIVCFSPRELGQPVCNKCANKEVIVEKAQTTLSYCVQTAYEAR